MLCKAVGDAGTMCDLSETASEACRGVSVETRHGCSDGHDAPETGDAVATESLPGNVQPLKVERLVVAALDDGAAGSRSHLS